MVRVPMIDTISNCCFWLWLVEEVPSIICRFAALKLVDQILGSENGPNGARLKSTRIVWLDFTCTKTGLFLTLIN